MKTTGIKSKVLPTTMLGSLLFTMCISSVSASEGSGWSTLENKIDAQVEAALVANEIPGATVAVSKNGRLILSKGYGLARAAGEIVNMKPDMRTRIGSVSKAVVTGPSGFQLMKQKGINRKTKKLYGANSVFGNKYANDIKMGVRRFSPIVAMAIAPDDDVYTWTIDGRVSVGTSNDLDRRQTPRSFSLAEGKLMTDIVDIGIAKNSRAYIWHIDGTVSIGQSRDLDMHAKILTDSDGKPRKVKFPSGKSMLDVVGIAIAKSNDHVYIGYADGTMSSGTSMDFTHYFTNRSYTLSGTSPYGIRALGIAANDHLYAWSGKNKAQSGTSKKWNHYRRPYDYSLPSLAAGTVDPESWYYDITIQHLLDHRSGFHRSGDTAGSMQMFNVSENALSYDQVHSHFLRTRPMRWKPGAASKYSNHGFGLWTLLIESMSGKSYRNYALNNYLNPMGVKGPMRPQTKNNDSNDAWPHAKSGDGYKVLDFKDSTLGLAAGGWTASAQTLLKITDKLQDQYTVQELDDMGWGKSSKGKLEHNGRTGGGTAYVAMFPPGYLSAGGADLSDIHIAIATNIRTSTGALESLSNKIAVAVPESNVSAAYDIWNNNLLGSN